jgi:hypothetical protein
VKNGNLLEMRREKRLIKRADCRTRLQVQTKALSEGWVVRVMS